MIIMNKYICFYRYLIPLMLICDPRFHTALLLQSSDCGERYLSNQKNRKMHSGEFLR